MNQATRVEKIEGITSRTSEIFGNQEIPWRDALAKFNVYKIPLEYLVYNKYNGRILSRTRSLETQGRTIEVETPEWKALIEKLLWESKESANKHTLQSLQELWQEKVGIITKDGIIIDGNRRAMLLNRAWKTHFKAIVLPVTLQEDRDSIEEFETTFQMGEDWKVDYNPIEKYLKAWDFHERWKPSDKIAKWMNLSEGKVNELIAIKDLIDEYLREFGYDWIYTQVGPWQEDLFISLNWWLKTFEWGESAKGFDGYTDADVADLKIIAFDYIRIKYWTEDKKFRKLATWLKGSHIFSNKEVWTTFANRYFNGIRTYKDKEAPIDFESERLQSHLEARDGDFKAAVFEFLDEIFCDAISDLERKWAHAMPAKLIWDSLKNLKAINLRNTDAATMDSLAEIRTIVTEILWKKSPIPILESILADIEWIDIDSIDDSDLIPAFELIKEINHKIYEIKREMEHH